MESRAVDAMVSRGLCGWVCGRRNEVVKGRMRCSEEKYSVVGKDGLFWKE